MSKKQRHRPVIETLQAETGRSLGHGQDNLVHELVLPEYAAALSSNPAWVVKVSHRAQSNAKKRNPLLSQKEAAISGTMYKKNKYHILKHFLGDTIPDSEFITGNVTQGDKTRPAEITFQKRVPQVQFNHLTEKQKSDPRLSTNVLALMEKLRYMYSVMGEANAMSGQGAAIDAKLDLGGVSDFVHSKDSDYEFTLQDAARTPYKNTSPNILVDPETLNIFCIDYDQGDWNPAMTSTMENAFGIDERRRALGVTALGGYVAPPSTDDGLFDLAV